MKTRTVALTLLMVLSFVGADPGLAQSNDPAIDSTIPGVTEADLQAVRQWWIAQSETSAVPTEAARVMWRIGRIGDRQLSELLEKPSSPAPNLPHAVAVQGEAVAVQKIPIPPRLAESLDFDTMWLVNVVVEDEEMGLLCQQIPSQWKTAKTLRQPMGARGFLIASPSQAAPGLLVCGHVQWFPTESDPDMSMPAGWLMLSQAGFNVGQMGLIQQRNRSALSAAESTAFYDFLKAAAAVPDDATHVPESIRPQVLLSTAESQKLIGQFIRVRLETARIQQIVAPSLMSQIGQDHYWEIDAFGDLDNAEVRIQPKEGGDPITFGNRYPVTLAMLELPPFLNELVSQDGRVTKAMLMHKAMIDVDGFFYRLWTYETDFVSSKGGDRQIGPLIAATAIKMKPPGSAKASLARIGWLIAILFLGGLLATIAYLTKAARADRQSRAKRNRSLPDVIPSLDDSKPSAPTG
ncbi:hypothetical protein Poly24_07270 [Rosistilla carotiformis]|uniref:Uncharacterized protein n=1 Tax=Rosistilla carotiformis TaxID=2528017 RepID=A0A518JNB7_9BACT|nr:hypothetical protein [Rosistilla carotiformis]QDV67036.1 hypothetical protein Poly24_07270 [Rosistilla carotiformis]